MIVSNGEIALAVWADNRSGTNQTFGARLDREGHVLDPLGLLIANGLEHSAVIWNGAEFAVMIAYDRIGPQSEGFVPRAVARVFTDPVRRRTASH